MFPDHDLSVQMTEFIVRQMKYKKHKTTKLKFLSFLLVEFVEHVHETDSISIRQNKNRKIAKCTDR